MHDAISYQNAEDRQAAESNIEKWSQEVDSYFDVVESELVSQQTKDTFQQARDAWGQYQQTVQQLLDRAGSATDSAGLQTCLLYTSIKGMVEDYNKMAKAIKDAYGTMPAQRSNGGSYEPLTDEDMADMSDEAIKNYEEKASQGLLFAYSDRSSLYSGLLSAITPSGTDGATLRSICLLYTSRCV